MAGRCADRLAPRQFDRARRRRRLAHAWRARVTASGQLDDYAAFGSPRSPCSRRRGSARISMKKEARAGDDRIVRRSRRQPVSNRQRCERRAGRASPSWARQCDAGRRRHGGRTIRAPSSSYRQGRDGARRPSGLSARFPAAAPAGAEPDILLAASDLLEHARDGRRRRRAERVGCAAARRP